jgi:SAM-dependent methyltransferase
MAISQTISSSICFRNPKRDEESRRGRFGWYQYYAGYSPSFVQDALAFSAAEAGVAQILDPWNGSGTTTQVSARNGFDSVGFDLNPVMVIVAKARTLHPNIQRSLTSLLEEILLRAGAIDQGFDDEPLVKWLSVETAKWIRRIEFALQLILVDPKKQARLAALPSLDNISALAAFFYVVLFRLLRQILKPFRSSNPTWIKGAAAIEERIHVSRKDLTSILRAQVAQMAGDLAAESLWVPTERVPHIRLDVASSLSLPLADNSVQVVVTSPPYCTRIDYVVKTGPELALLGLADRGTIHDLRDRMIGTPTIVKGSLEPSKEWGKACLGLLTRVSRHKSRASKSYYLKTQIQYFDGLYKSLGEINRTLAKWGECFFVVQDSYYKEIHMDLAQILKEMGRSLGWEHDMRRDFASSRTMVRVNSGARVYGKPRLAVESVLHFTKARAEG